MFEPFIEALIDHYGDELNKDALSLPLENQKEVEKKSKQLEEGKFGTKEEENALK